MHRSTMREMMRVEDDARDVGVGRRGAAVSNREIKLVTCIFGVKI